MRGRMTFLAGFAAGFMAGARAGRERYEQMVKFGRKAAEHPAVRQATRAVGAKASELSKTAGQKAAERMPKLAETARNSAGKVRDRIPGRNTGEDDSSTANGTRPVD
jgi:hypothetical protein